MKILSRIAGAALVCFALAGPAPAPAPAPAQDRLGIVLMHGKQGSPTSSPPAYSTASTT